VRINTGKYWIWILLALMSLTSFACAETVQTGMFVAETMQAGDARFDTSTLSGAWLYLSETGDGIWMDDDGCLPVQWNAEQATVQVQDLVFSAGFDGQLLVLETQGMNWNFRCCEPSVLGGWEDEETGTRLWLLPDGSGQVTGADTAVCTWSQTGLEGILRDAQDTQTVMHLMDDGNALELVWNTHKSRFVRIACCPAEASASQAMAGFWTVRRLDDPAVNMSLPLTAPDWKLWIREDGTAAEIRDGQAIREYRLEADRLLRGESTDTLKAENGILQWTEGSSGITLILEKSASVQDVLTWTTPEMLPWKVEDGSSWISAQGIWCADTYVQNGNRVTADSLQTLDCILMINDEQATLGIAVNSKWNEIVLVPELPYQGVWIAENGTRWEVIPEEESLILVHGQTTYQFRKALPAEEAGL